MSMKVSLRKMQKPKIQFVTDLHTFESILSSDSGHHLSKLKVYGNFTPITDEHPVVEAVLSRWKANSKPGMRRKGDTKKIALAIEGGGMRGCVSAGATAALNILGIHDAIDVVYGSSAGAMIGAYFISRQFSGVQIYHDILPSAGKRFIDKGKLLFAAGLPSWLNVFLRRKRGTIDEIMSFIPDPDSIGTEQSRERTDKSLTNVINLDFLLVQVMGILQPLDWNMFTKNELTQPLKIVASSLKTLKPIVMSREKSNFGDLPSLLECIRASMAVPGITGSLMALSKSSNSEESTSKSSQEFSVEASSEPLHVSPYSVPFYVNMRSKPNQPYQTNTISTSILKSSSKSLSQIGSATNMKLNRDEDISTYNGRGVIGMKLIRKFLGVGRIAIMALVKLVDILRAARDKRAMAVVVTTSIESDIMDTRRDSKVIPAVNSASGDGKFASRGTQVTNLKANIRERKRERNGDNDVDDDRTNTSTVTADNCEPVVDAFLCEPLPYRSAVDDGASHVIVLRTRPDPCPVLGKGPGVFETLIAKRYALILEVFDSNFLNLRAFTLILFNSIRQSIKWIYF